MGDAPQRTTIRDAATVIVLRDRLDEPKILMGQRGAKAAFMPNKFVFPGGAVDATDAAVPFSAPLPELCSQRLSKHSAHVTPEALAAAAIRELWEETGLVLGRPAPWPDPSDPWCTFAATHNVPAANALQFIFRAITPPGRPRRFDARFFLVDAAAIVTDLDDFSAASDELSHLQWVSLSEARRFDMPFITEVVLAEVAARVQDPRPPKSVPFFKNNDEDSLFQRLRVGPNTCSDDQDERQD